jgi:AraC-like DNA-binding protein
MNILEYENYQEKISHGDPLFPYITYLCSIPLDFQCVPLHWHDEMEFIYIKKGKGLITVDLKQYEVTAGAIVFILPGQLHSIEQSGNASMEYENIIFHPNILISKKTDTCNSDFFQPLLAGTISVPLLYTPDAPYYREISACLNENDEICKTNPAGYQLFLKSQLFMLFFLLFNKCSRKEPQKKNHKSLDKMKVILKYIEIHYMEKITIADMAKELNVSESHFMKYFKNTMGTSFIDYLNEYRLTMASRLLISSESSVLAIASEVGFDNLSYFNRSFKKRFGQTPREYRKALVPAE